MARSKRTFSPEFRAEAVKLVIVSSRPTAQVARELGRARFVVTDSGGLQEESAHLGIPCAVHRARTERHDGKGQNMVLTGLSTDKLRAFLDDYERYGGGICQGG